MRSVLMVAFHFPPQQGSSGIQRTLRFVQHLPRHGWQPIVLTAHKRAYERTTIDLTAEVPESVPVIRAAAWDSARHLAIAGRYPDFLGSPDRWVSWWPFAVLAGLRAIRQYRPSAIWSTFPLATAHMIAHTLVRATGIPWLADFRDPMAQDGYPEQPAVRRRYVSIERSVVAHATSCTFTTPSAVETYKKRYPAFADRFFLLENGFDEESFLGISPADPLVPGKLTLVHSGVVYPSERDPTQLFAALALLKFSVPAIYQRLLIRFRAAAHEDLLSALADRYEVQDAIEVAPALAYRPALREMISADALLLLQASNCNEQIPAKLYEYVRAGRPIIALTDQFGDTATTVRRFGIDSIARIDDASSIAEILKAFVAGNARFRLPDPEIVALASRHKRASELALLLQRTVSE